jgi:hypothetical protein
MSRERERATPLQYFNSERRAMMNPNPGTP